MKLKITNQVKYDEFWNSFKVVVTFMIGDADGYTDQTFCFDGEQFYDNFEESPSVLLEFIQFIDDCKNAFPNGRGGSDNYNHVNNYDKMMYIIDDKWPGEPGTSDPQTLVEYKITYFNPDGIEYHVEVVK